MGFLLVHFRLIDSSVTPLVAEKDFGSINALFNTSLDSAVTNGQH